MTPPPDLRPCVCVAIGAVVENVSSITQLAPAISAPHAPIRTPLSDLRVLITRRRSDQVLGNLWELPGGKIHPNESPQDAAMRELREEVGITVRCTDALPAVEHNYDHARVSLHPFICVREQGLPRAIEVAEVRWVSLDELAHYEFPRASLPVIASLRSVLGSPGTSYLPTDATMRPHPPTD